MHTTFNEANLFQAARSISAVIAAFAAMMCCLSHATAATLNDDLNNWNLAAGHSGVLTLDGGNVAQFDGDMSRVKCGGAGVGSFYYHLPRIQSFSALTYYFRQPSGGIDVYVSPDSVTWTKIAASFTPAQPTTSTGDWFYMVMTPSGPIPDGTNYVGFTVKSGIDVFTPEIGRVTLTYGESGGPAPEGLSLMSAGGQTCLVWYPEADATSYNIKRSVDGNDFETVATEIKSTMYSDTGLKPGVRYYYAVSANSPSGETDAGEAQSGTSQTDAVVFEDPLTDWSLAARHTPDFVLGDILPNVRAAHCASNSNQSVVYNMPGLTNFAFTVYFDGTTADEVFAQVSPDGDHWKPVKLKLGMATSITARWKAAECAPSGPLQAGGNYLKIGIDAQPSPGTGEISADSTRIGQIRLTYGATDHR